LKCYGRRLVNGHDFQTNQGAGRWLFHDSLSSSRDCHLSGFHPLAWVLMMSEKDKRIHLIFFSMSAGFYAVLAVIIFFINFFAMRK
jgi:hypothetical protein